MIEVYLIIGLILAIGAMLCDARTESDKKVYCMVFVVLLLAWPAVIWAALARGS